MLTFTIPQNEEFIEIQEQPIRLIIAGWTGRDADKVQEHIEELAAIGVPKPSTGCLNGNRRDKLLNFRGL